jgi:hypothetical protein
VTVDDPLVQTLARISLNVARRQAAAEQEQLTGSAGQRPIVPPAMVAPRVAATAQRRP